MEVNMTQNDDCPFSMVAACRMTGQSPQEAFDTVGNLLEERYQYWQKAIEQLPSWGPEIDANVARYIQGIQNVVQANITWRYEIAAESETKLNAHMRQLPIGEIFWETSSRDPTDTND
jgi:translation initiation factor 2 alpha subunit (eIF-2alpha)